MAAPSSVELSSLLQQIAGACHARGCRIATAESCTGGWIAKCLTDLPGSSHWFDLGIVSYSNEAKQHLLRVRPQTLESHGAVSEAVVCEMAQGVLAQSGAALALSVSGIAGPDGGSADKPVGTVWFAWCWRDQPPQAQRRQFAGSRDEVRRQSVQFALEGALQRLTD